MVAELEERFPDPADIQAESLNEEAAKRYLLTSLKRGYASENGTELNSILPKMSPLNPKYLTIKQSVFQKIDALHPATREEIQLLRSSPKR